MLLFANSEENANLFYASRFFAPDPFACLIIPQRQRGEKKLLLLNDLEIDRGRREAQVDTVESISALSGVEQKRIGHSPTYPEILRAWLRRHRVSRIRVPEEFPLGLARALEKSGVQISVGPAQFFPEREVKTAADLRAMRRALAITEAGMERAWEVLRASTIQPRTNRLHWGGEVLTSERLRAEIDTCILRRGGFPRGTIVAGGNQACDPHERGSGPLFAHQLIILDIFPRDLASGFYGDLTRTVVRGRASEAQRHLWQICLEGQRQALKAIKPGLPGRPIHCAIQEFFAREGYPTRQHKGRWEGFFHGTGHGLGLEVHEEPRFAAATFRPGQVFTVEPGIYRHGLGGVRHEDVVFITASGSKLLTSLPKPFEI